MKKTKDLSDDGAIVPGMPAPKTLGEALMQLTNNPATPKKHALWLANELGFVNGGIVTHWRNGRHKPRPDTLQKIADIYGIPYAKLAVLPSAPKQSIKTQIIEVGGKVLRVNEQTGETHLLIDADGSPEWKLVKE